MPAATTPRCVAEVSGVSKSFRNTRALADVSLRVTAGRQHALLGRNGAGKSTLVSILTGIVPPDSGTIAFEGEPCPPRGAPERWRAKVACVYQQSSLVPSLSIVENLFLNKLPKTALGLVDWSGARREARTALSSWGLDIDVDAAVGKLTVVQKQLVEIVRALLQGSRFIILDEPTAHLEPGEIARLFERMRLLAGQGVTFLYISHHLEEIFQVCDEATILRDGRVVASGPVASFGNDGIVKAMVGSAAATISRAVPQKRQDPGQRGNVLEIDGLTIPRLFSGIDLTLKTGERVGIAGSGSSGSVELAETIAGLRRPANGTIQVGGRALRPGEPRDAIEAGLGFIPGERAESGYCPNLGVGENIVLPVLRRFTKAGWLRQRALRELGRQVISRIGVIASSRDQLIVELSGGNQQKAVIGRALVSEPKVLVLVKPTAGVDVASKAAVFELIRRYEEVGVLVVSDERDDLELCDRILVMRRGSIVNEFGVGWTFDQIVGELEGVRGNE